LETELRLHLDWKPNYCIGYERFDAEHEELFMFANRVIEAIHENQAQGLVEGEIINLQNHIEAHFLNEEITMAEAGYGWFTEHRAAHKAELDRLRTYIADFISKPLEAAQVHGFLERFLLGHIQRDDSRYVSTLTARGGMLTEI